MENNITNILSNKDFDVIMKDVQTKLSTINFEELAKKSYNEDRNYPENFSNWYPYIEDFGIFSHVDIINNQIFTFEEVEAFQEVDTIEKVNWDKLNKVLKPTLDKMNPNTIYNIKNGCFSNKFNFETCLVTKNNLAQQLWKINYESHMFETGGHTELVVREYIPYNKAHNMTIYNGMPLRTEVRVFYNMDTKEIEYATDYWNYEYCKDNIYCLNDKMIFDIFHNQIGSDRNITTCHWIEYEDVLEKIKLNISSLKFNDKLRGIWSIDFMYVKETDKIYLIDMARGFRSAYWDIDKLLPETQEEYKNG